MNIKNLLKLLFNNSKKTVENSNKEFYELSISSVDTYRLDSYSSTWMFIENWAKKELAETRRKNDATTLDIVQTAHLRGRIKLLKELLELSLPPKRDRVRSTNTSIVDE